jgi:predicted O-methyltransferase YrrM
MTQPILLGMGTGQCGTQLLAEILSRQPNTNVTHEQPPLLSWSLALSPQDERDRGALIRNRLSRIRRTRRELTVGDVASFYLPYVEDAIAFDSTIRIVCLQRPRDEVVAAFCRFLDERAPFPINHWARECATGWQHDPIWTRCFPQYDTQDRAEGIGRYWDEYTTKAEELARRFPDNVRIWDTEVLTTEPGVREVLSFAGIPSANQVVVTGQRPTVVDSVAPSNEPRGSRYPHPMDPRRCVILVPFNGFIHQECDDALKELERRGYTVRRVGGYAAIDQGRNQMAADALLAGFEETLWIDADVGFHPDAVDQLRSHPYSIVAGIYPQKGRRALACHIMPGAPSITFGQRGRLVELLYAGTGFLLIRREAYMTVMEKMHLPVCNERFGHPTIPFFLPMVRPIEEGSWYLAEDYAFCQRARESGLRIYADTSIRLWHIGYYRYGWEDAGLERQRFGSFTLNFGPGPQQERETATERPPVLADFAEQHPWPLKPPEVPPFPQRNWLFPATQQLLAGSVSEATRLIVEVGSWTGRSTRFLAGLARQATIVAIDHWEGSPEHHEDAELAPFLPHLYETFLAECWDDRKQIVPIRANSTDGMQQVAEAGLQPDLVYIDADHSFEGVRRDLTMALELFPNAVIVGDDLDWEEVHRAVDVVTKERQLRLEIQGAAWRIVR